MLRRLHDQVTASIRVRARMPGRGLARLATVVALAATAACGGDGTAGGPTDLVDEPVAQADGPVVGPVRPPSYVAPMRPNVEAGEVGLPEPERPPVGEGQFLGAMRIERRSNASDDDRLVVHRLNSGFWREGSNEQYVEIDPLLDYGPVFDQTSDPPGTVGGTTLVAIHNITRPPPEVTQVTIDGVTYRHSRMMLSQYNEEQLAREFGTRQFRPNVTAGDRFEIILNNPNRTTTVLGYEVDGVRDMPPDGPEFKALKAPPGDPTASRLVVYSCWEPGDDKLRQAATAVLRSRVTNRGEVADPGPQPRRATVLR